MKYKKKKKILKLIKYDPNYKHKLVNLFVNMITKNGNKLLAYKIVYRILKLVKKKTKKNPLPFFKYALLKLVPNIIIKKLYRNGVLHTVPIEIEPYYGKKIAIRWLLNSSKKRYEKSIVLKFVNELIETIKGNSMSISFKKKVYKVIESNKIFSFL
nr:ribosomal protein S7 [Thonningia sanguinea]WJE89165.1 ribosomal protein S7 [Thonningia sanguinea]